MGDKSQAIIDINDLKSAWRGFARNWFYFIIFPAVTAVAGYFYIQKLTEMYAAKTQILIKSDEVYNYQANLYKNLGYYNKYENISNQIRVIRSTNMLRKVIRKLNPSVSYYIVGRIKTEEQYRFMPFSVTAEKINYEYYEQEMGLKIIDANHYQLTYSKKEEDIQKTYAFGEQLFDNGLLIKVDRISDFKPKALESLKKMDYMFKIHHHRGLINKYQRNITVTNVEWTDILEITVLDEIQARATAFLDTLARTYVNYTIQSKFDVNENTLLFIDKQLTEVTEILSGIEDGLEQYKESKAILNLSREEERYFKEMVEYELGKRSLNIRLKALDALESYLLGSEDERLLPPAFYVDEKDDYFVKALDELYSLQIQRTALLFEATESSVAIIQLDEKLDLLKKDILTYLYNTRNAVNEKIVAVEEQILSYEAILRTIPKTQRDMLDIQRKRQVFESLYSYLLEKRASTIIARAGIVPETKVIDSAHPIGRVQPDKYKIMYYFLAVGMLIGLVWVFLRMLFFSRIETVEELKKITEAPIIGEIIRFKDSVNYLVVDADPRSRVTESFRMIRANLDYFAAESSSKVILVTSHSPGEGKTFCSINLAAILAKAGKKVLIAEMDMHKPKIKAGLNVESETGMSSVLIGKETFEHAKVNTSIENLDVILCGPIPPNPSEIVLSKNLQKFLDEARENYDYIIIDSPPVGLITDAFTLMKVADITLFVINSKVAKKEFVNNLDEIAGMNKLENYGMILNGVKLKKSGYYYKYYGYGYGYGEEKKEA